MLTRRRIMLQLTPLLDLLLIVIFAQYLEVRESAAHQQKTAAISQQRSDQMQQDLQRTADRLHRQLTQLQGDVRQSQELNRQLMELFLLQLQIPPQQMNGLMKDLVARLAGESVISPVEPPAEAVTTESAERQQRRMLQFLQTYVELRKRSDVWELYLADNGVVTLMAGDSEQTFRASDAEGFAQRLFDAYKKLPQPKGLVVMLLSYGDTRADDRQRAIRGLQLAARRMQDDRGDATRFEFSVLGYQPHKPERPIR
ncbi:MAG: hypothetical protein O2955_00065 [Planctomycetota bacterium]|nr:hypothetical protein [Planctomycetota bacterium]MDA1210874.1 hypothetical protein [Planctomycetota bacterium]